MLTGENQMPSLTRADFEMAVMRFVPIVIAPLALLLFTGFEFSPN
jgi:hypothetical protein